VDSPISSLGVLSFTTASSSHVQGFIPGQLQVTFQHVFNNGVANATATFTTSTNILDETGASPHEWDFAFSQSSNVQAAGGGGSGFVPPPTTTPAESSGLCIPLVTCVQSNATLPQVLVAAIRQPRIERIRGGGRCDHNGAGSGGRSLQRQRREAFGVGLAEVTAEDSTAIIVKEECDEYEADAATAPE